MKRTVHAAVILLSVLAAPGCAYFNTLYNARVKFEDAQSQKEKADPERTKISSQEERLYTDAFEKAARVVKYHPNSKWVDDALLLMGKASFEKSDYATAERKFQEILTFYPDSDLTAEALLMKGRTLIATKDYDAGVAALTVASELDDKDFRDDVAYFLGVVHYEKGDVDEALASFSNVLSEHRKSEWFADAGIRAGEIERERGNLWEAASYYDAVRARSRTPRDRFRGGILKGEALLELGEYKRAKTTFRDAAKRTTKREDQGKAFVMVGKATAATGDHDAATGVFHEILTKFALQAAAADAQLAIAELHDESGDYVEALAQYELVKEQGTGHEAWQTASARRAEIQRMLDLRDAVADSSDPDRDKNRFLLAEQLLERIGDVDGALAEYSSLADEAAGTEWGARALFAEAWVLGNRLDRPDDADSLLFQLANYYTGTEVGTFARKKFGYPVWSVEILEPPPVKFVRSEQNDEPADVVLARVEPRPVPLPDGVDEVKVWVRVRVAENGSADDVKVVKSGAGAEFDEAALEAARASTFLAPSAGGPAFNVMEFSFPPPSAAPALDDEPSADERDAMLDARDATVTPAASPILPDAPPAAPDSAVADSAAAETVPPPEAVGFRDRNLPGANTPD